MKPVIKAFLFILGNRERLMEKDYTAKTAFLKKQHSNIIKSLFCPTKIALYILTFSLRVFDGKKRETMK